MKKIIFSIVLIITLTLTLTGCFGKNEKSNKELTLDYLNSTYSSYNDTFTYINCSYDLFNGWNDRCYFKSEKYDDEIEVTISKENDNYNFADNYYQLYMMEDAVKYFNLVGNSANAISKVRFQSYIFSDNIENSKTFEEYINSGKCNIDVYFVSNNQFTQEQIDLILNSIAKNQIQGYFNFIQTNNNDLLKDYSISDIVNNHNELVISEHKYNINNQFKITKTN